MTPLERAAKALFLSGARPSSLPGQDVKQDASSDWDACHPDAKVGFMNDARAVLQAIRKPSEAMLGATDNLSVEPDAAGPRRGELFWQAMIDAALDEG